MRILKVDSNIPSADAIREAAEAIRRGALVIFPTETVYGLAANALDPEAVRRVFEAKGRPLSIPLPVQVGDKAQIEEVAIGLSDAALRLVDAFMPGPITIVVKRSACVPDIVTAGGDTVGVRIPANAVALALIREVGGPIVATSANRSGEKEPLDADNAARQIGVSVDLVLDAGPSQLGEASTVVDTTCDPPRILRKGALSVDEIRKVIEDITEY